MELQYISDKLGKPTAVIIPINDWNIITAKHQDLKELEEEKSVLEKKRKASDFRGILSKEVARKMLLDIEESRNEWDRNF